MSTVVAGQNPALDAQTRVPILVGTALAFTIVSSLVVLLRLYTRYAVVHSAGIDDYTMLVAAILAIGVTVSTILQADNGLGRHQWLVTHTENLIQLKSLLAGEVLYNLSQIVIKISFLLQYRRIFRDHLTRTICFWLIMYLLVWGVAQEVLVGLACIPVSIFIPSRANECIPSLIVWYLTSIMNIATDFIIFLVPIPAVRNLRLPLRQKALVMSIFGLGFFTCVISIVRLFTLRAALNSEDGSWENAPTSWWTTIELNCGILCSSIATLRPLIRYFSPNKSSNQLTEPAAGYQRQPASQTSGDDSDGVERSYPLRLVKSTESQNGLKKETFETTNGSVASYE
ncbi:hypothetical protein SPI_02127 [Niveomyces insectorum RCEF 264]|uniref:Rhodopsin domain-containing protein n=1 Tax=Niveomyces insectorum RCEF 264 TaxID=1081102 RepID=A0A162MQM9_9HYPO|nr:hypothetical protein SPI_02127 [Niveomyces insectorum RCEF 264]